MPRGTGRSQPQHSVLTVTKRYHAAIGGIEAVTLLRKIMAGGGVLTKSPEHDEDVELLLQAWLWLKELAEAVFADPRVFAGTDFPDMPSAEPCP
jgi:hypothetical protein